MTAKLTSELALTYLAQLSVDIRAAAVIATGSDQVLSGDRALAESAVGLFEAGTDQLCIERGDETLLGVRTELHTVVVTAGPYVLRELLLVDLRTLLADLNED